MAKPLAQRDLYAVNHAPEVQLTDEQVNELANKTNAMLWDQFKIDVDLDRTPSVDENGNSRIQIFGRDREGREGLYSPQELGILPGSKEFVRAAESGRVYVYPAGKEKPVQLQAYMTDPKNPTKNNGGFAVSRELEAEDIQLPAPKRMGFWRGAARVLTFGLAYRARANRIRKQREDYPRLRQKMSKIREQRLKSSEKELQDVPKIEETRKKREEYSKDQKCIQEKKVGMRNFVSIFQPKPEFRPELEKILPDKKNGIVGKEGLYTKEHFQALGTYDKMDMKIGTTEKLSPEEFAAVAMFTCWRPDHAMHEFENGDNFDPTLRQALINCGFTDEKKLDTILTSQYRNLATTDVFSYPKGRDNEGKKFSYYVEPARKEAAEAFTAYKNGKPEHLAQLIANGINRAAEDFNTVDTNRLGYNSYGTIQAAKPLFSLMKKDPNLKTLALANGMDPERLQCMEGMIKLDELESGDREATERLSRARLEGNDLKPQEKFDCAKKIVMSRLAMQRLAQHNYKVDKGPNSITEKLLENVTYDTSISNIKDRSKWPQPEPGKVYYTNMYPVKNGLAMAYGGLPKIGLELSNPAEVQKLENLAEQIVVNEKLAEHSTEQLYTELHHASKQGLKLTDALNRVMQPRNAEPELEHQGPKLNIQKNEKKDFRKDENNPQPEFKGVGY